MITCTIGAGEETEKYTCPSEPWDTENTFCCGLNEAKVCCTEAEYSKMSDDIYGTEAWELLGHSLSLTLLLVLGIACCICCFCCPCCPAFRWRMRRGRVIRTPDTAARIPMGPVSAAPPAPPQYPAAGYTGGYTGGYQLHPPPPVQSGPPPGVPIGRPFGAPFPAQAAAGYARGGSFPPSAPPAPGWGPYTARGPAPDHWQHDEDLLRRLEAQRNSSDPPPPYPGTGP